MLRHGLPQPYRCGSLTAPCIVHSSIMVLRRIDILKAENICNKINIACFLIQRRTVRTTQFMRRNFLRCRHLGRIFLLQIFHRLDVDPFSLRRLEECVFVSCHRCNTCADFDILFQCLGNFISKVDKHFISTFSKHFDAIVFKIDILNI